MTQDTTLNYLHFGQFTDAISFSSHIYLLYCCIFFNCIIPLTTFPAREIAQKLREFALL